MEKTSSYDTILADLDKYVMEHSADASHDYYHVVRVLNNVVSIYSGLELSEDEIFIVKVGTLLHDAGRNKVRDFQKDNEHEVASAEIARRLLAEYGVPDVIIRQVEECILNHRTNKIAAESSKLAKIVYDADKLDALGAIAIARTFAYSSGRPIYLPQDTPKAVYDGTSTSGINHIMEKVLKITPDKFYTPTAKIIAKERLKYAEEYVAEFLAEWNGER